MDMEGIARFASQQLVRSNDFHPVCPPRSINRDYTEKEGKLLAYIAIHCINESLLARSQLFSPHSISAPEVAGITYLVCLCEAMAHAIHVCAMAQDDGERQRRNQYVTYIINSFELWYMNYQGWMSKAGNGVILTLPTSFNKPIYKMREWNKKGLQLPVVEDAAEWKESPYEASCTSSVVSALEGADQMRHLLGDIGSRFRSIP